MVEYKQYAWQDIRIKALGRSFVGVRGVKYKGSSDDEHLHGRGKRPIAIQSGNETFDGELVLLQSEVIALTKALGIISLRDIRFDLVVTYQPADGGDVSTDIIKSVKVTEYEKSMSQGDKFMEITIPFLAMDIIENV